MLIALGFAEDYARDAAQAAWDWDEGSNAAHSNLDGHFKLPEGPAPLGDPKALGQWLHQWQDAGPGAPHNLVSGHPQLSALLHVLMYAVGGDPDMDINRILAGAEATWNALTSALGLDVAFSEQLARDVAEPILTTRPGFYDNPEIQAILRHFSLPGSDWFAAAEALYDAQAIMAGVRVPSMGGWDGPSGNFCEVLNWGCSRNSIIFLVE